MYIRIFKYASAINITKITKKDYKKSLAKEGGKKYQYGREQYKNVSEKSTNMGVNNIKMSLKRKSN